MGNRFASGKWAIAQCDRCDGRFKLKQLRREIIKTKNYELLVCPECWDPDQPQLQLGMFPVDDPQGLRNPRPDRSYLVSGLSGLQLVDSTSPNPNAQGTVEGGSRVFQWGWNPVGGAAAWDAGVTPNNLFSHIQLGTVTVELDTMPGAMLGGVSSAGEVGKALGPLPITGVETPISAGTISGPGFPVTGVAATGAVSGLGYQKTLNISASGATFSFFFQPWGFPSYYMQIWDTSPQNAALISAIGSAFYYAPSNVALFIDATPTYPAAPSPASVNLGYMSNVNFHVGYIDINLFNPSANAIALGTGNFYVNSAVRPVGEFGNIPPEIPFDSYTTVGSTGTFRWGGSKGANLRDMYAQQPVLPAGTEIWGAVSVYQDFIWVQYYWHLGTLVSMGYDSGTATFFVTYTVITPFIPYAFPPTAGMMQFVSSGMIFVPTVLNV